MLSHLREARGIRPIDAYQMQFGASTLLGPCPQGVGVEQHSVTSGAWLAPLVPATDQSASARLGRASRIVAHRDERAPAHQRVVRASRRQGRDGAALCYHPGARTCRPSLEACSRVRKCAIFFVDGSLRRTDANDNPRTLAQSHLQDTCNRTLLYPTPFWTSAVNNTFLKHRNAATLSAASKIARGGRCRAEIRLRDRSSCRSVALDDRIVSESRPIPSVNATQEGGHCWVPAVLACNAGSPRTPQRFS